MEGTNFLQMIKHYITEYESFYSRFTRRVWKQSEEDSPISALSFDKDNDGGGNNGGNGSGDCGSGFPGPNPRLMSSNRSLPWDQSRYFN